MIYDLIPLPMRSISGDVSTTCPMFHSLVGLDDITCYGRSINLDRAKEKFFKYKSIENIGPAAFERLFLTTEPIDFKKRWISSSIKIYPILFKVFKPPFKQTCDVYRYLNGSVNALSIIDEDAHIQTVGDKLIKIMWPYDPGLYIPKRTYNLIPHIVGGSDIENICNYQSVYEYMDTNDNANVFDYYNKPISELFPNYPEDATESIFLRDMSISDLKPFVTSQCINGMMRNVLPVCEPPFKITKNTIFSEDNEFCRWTLHSIIQSLERSVYTDLYLELKCEDGHKTKLVQCDLYSRYIGLSATKLDGEDAFIRELAELLRKWSCMTTGETPISIKLWKTWSEEIFITIKTSRGDRNYYFDLALYSLVNMSFVDMFS